MNTKKNQRKLYLSAGDITFKVGINNDLHGNARRRAKKNLRDTVLNLYEERMRFNEEHARLALRKQRKLI